MLRVYLRHLRTAQYCKPGAQDWWQRQGLDWRDFCKHGIDAQTLIATGDPMALRVVEIARNENVE